jgi:hypothetical protein
VLTEHPTPVRNPYVKRSNSTPLRRMYTIAKPSKNRCFTNVPGFQQQLPDDPCDICKTVVFSHFFEVVYIRLNGVLLESVPKRAGPSFVE